MVVAAADLIVPLRVLVVVVVVVVVSCISRATQSPLEVLVSLSGVVVLAHPLVSITARAARTQLSVFSLPSAAGSVVRVVRVVSLEPADLAEVMRVLRMVLARGRLVRATRVPQAVMEIT